MSAHRCSRRSAYFLSPLLLLGAAGAAFSVEAAGLEVSGAELELEAGGGAAGLESPGLVSFLALPYRSEYQPPPFRTKEVRLTTRLRGTFAPQPSHRSGPASPAF